ncbi:MAG: ribosomal protein S18-alanine N-acetyltransferase [Anaerolineae bacterium]|nr:ribosomal protein S18-alanine N-acetyltransferase [Anaerolineae bacterium]
MSQLLLRYMQPADISQVVVIDNQSFDPPWSARSYTYEISESSYSHMAVLMQDAPPAQPPVTGWKRLLKGFGTPHVEGDQIVVGYGGLWNIVDEGHISTIATHPAWRGHGYGEVLLAGMVRRAITLKAAYIVLEVRVSNRVAQNLYTKYEFQTTGVKVRYYRNNNEDAYEMRLDLDNREMLARFDQRFAEIQARVPFIDQYTAVTGH